MIAINLSKQQTFDADGRVIPQINFIRNLDRAGNTGITSFILEEANKIV